MHYGKFWGLINMSDNILTVRDLHLQFKVFRGLTKVLHGISLSVSKGERVALVGESGSGKSVTARIILGLLQEQRQASVSGEVTFAGQSLMAMSNRQRAAMRGTQISMIFQDPTSSLNPVYPVFTQFKEVIRRTHPAAGDDEVKAIAIKALADVAIHEPERVLSSYSFQLSGGMNQRIMIAMALVNRPQLLLADEPGTALDVTVQAQTLKLMSKLVEKHGTSVLFISHNLGVVREFADRVYVIYKGRIVEHGTTNQIFSGPQHPYTQALLAAVPKITGGGIPNIADHLEDFLAPRIDHPQTDTQEW
jgi:peptide/nickel transport system ATP-binding protein